MSTNALLVAHTALTAPTGRGEPTFGPNRLALPTPCTVTEPRQALTWDAAGDARQVDLVVTVLRRAFVVGGRMPQPGDRITVEITALLGQQRTGDVIDCVDGGGELVTIRLAKRADDACGGVS